MNHIIQFGKPPEDYLHIKILTRSYSGASDYWDANWLTTKVQAHTGTSQTKFQATMRAEEFKLFLRQLKQMLKSKMKRAKFETMEEWLTIDVVSNGQNNFVVKCSIDSKPSVGKRMEFMIKLCREDIKNVMKQLKMVVKKFPTIGRP